MFRDPLTRPLDSPEAFAQAAAARFEIVRKLGEGGFGAVYEARDRETGGRVAVKTIRDVQGEDLYRFKQEFRALADLVHPNLVQLYELGSVEGRWFFSMELVEGADFVSAVRLPEGGFDEARLRAALGELATGLAALHQAGRLHRDIKPPNVLVTAAGRAVIVDFGLSVRLTRSTELRRSALLGTAEYLAPEQIHGAPASEATDWYAVGTMLWAALVGRPPFHGALNAVLAQKVTDDPPAPSSLAPGVPRDLDRLCVELLRRQPEQRPSGAEILARLGAPGRPLRRRIPFVGRAAELQEIGELVRALKVDRAPSVALVRGASGIGKSALLRQARAEARRIAPGALVFSARCYEQESVPYKALDGLADALSRYLGQLPAALTAALLPKDAPALARVFPVFEQVPALAEGGMPLLGGDPVALRRRAFRALREILERIAAERPVLLVIDDLQWGDEESGAALVELLTPKLPSLLLLAAYRSDTEDVSPCLHAALPALRALPGVRLCTLDLGALHDDDARALARAALPPEAPDAAAEAVVREALGQPLLVRAIADFASARPPAEMPSLDAFLAARVAALPEAPRRLLEAVCIAGRPVDRAAAMLCAGVAGEGRAALKVLRVARLARRRDAGDRQEIEPYHDRIRAVVAAGLTPERRADLLLRLAAALTAASAAETETLASYYLQGGDLARAADLSARAAGEAAEALAFDRAARLYRQGLALLSVADARRSALEEALGEVLLNAGRGAEAAAAFEAASAGASADRAADLRRRAAEQLLVSGHVDEGMAGFRSALGEVGVRFPDQPWQLALGIVYYLVWLRVRGFGSRVRAASEVDPAALRRVDACALATRAFATIDTVSGLYFCVRTLRLALSAGEPRRALDALLIFAGFVASAGPPARSLLRRATHAAEALAPLSPGPHTTGWLRLLRGVEALHRGDTAPALGHLTAASTILREQSVGDAWALDVARDSLCQALDTSGAWGALAARLPGDLAEARERGDRHQERMLQIRYGHIPALLADRPDLAAEAHASARQGWWPPRFGSLDNFALLSSADRLLYEDSGRGPRAHAAQEGAWPALARSGLLRIEAVATAQFGARARAALACAAHPETSARDRARALRVAAQASRRLTRFTHPMARPLQALAEGGLSAARGDRETAAARMAEAEAGFAEGGYAHFAAASLRQRGVLVGGEAGEAMIREGEARLAAEGARAPERLARMLVPVG